MGKKLTSYEEQGQWYIYIFRPIDEAVALEVVKKIFEIEAKMISDGIPVEDRVITLVFNSPGGSVSDGKAIYDTMGICSCEIETICVGMAASMAAFQSISKDVMRTVLSVRFIRLTSLKYR